MVQKALRDHFQRQKVIQLEFLQLTMVQKVLENMSRQNLFQWTCSPLFPLQESPQISRGNEGGRRWRLGFCRDRFFDVMGLQKTENGANDLLTGGGGCDVLDEFEIGCKEM
ncbi:hypothetical protein LXL04_019122 [Taraxacum kok-saghyz]